METNKVKINTVNGAIEVTSLDQFRKFGETFHVTISRENENLFTVTHEGTGFAIDIDVDTIGDAMSEGIKFLEKKGKKKLRKAIRSSNWFLWKHKYLTKKLSLKRLLWWIYYLIITILSIIGAAVVGLYIGGSVTVTF